MPMPIERSRAQQKVSIALRSLVASLRQRFPAIVAAAVAWVLYRVWRLRNLKGRLAPAPHSSMFNPLGALIPVLNHYHDMPDWYVGLAKKYGKNFLLTIGHPLAAIQNLMVITDPAGLQHVLKTRFENYEKGDFLQDLMRETFGHGIFGVDGEAWYRQRKTTSLIFSAENMRTEMMRTMTKNVHVLIEALRTRSEGGTQAVDVQKLFFDFQMDTFCEIGFGVECGSLGATPVKKFQDFAVAFDSLQSLCPERPFRPGWKIQKRLANLAMKGWPIGFLAGTEMKIARYKACVDDVICEIIQKRQQAGAMSLTLGATTPGNVTPRDTSKEAASPSSSLGAKDSDDKPEKLSRRRSRSSSRHDETKRLDLLELFMDMQPPLKLQELQDVVMSLLVGGRDTTSVTLTWAMYELARNPEVAAKLKAEVETIKFENANDLYSALKNMPYADCIVRETIRLHTPVPIDSKICLSEDVLPDGHYVGRGWTIMYSPYVMARDTDLWGPDAAEWRPERWLDVQGEPSPFVYSAFNAGPRICLGRDLALLEAKAVITLLTYAGVKMELWPTMGDKEPKYIMGVVLKMVDPGLLMKVTIDDKSCAKFCQ